MPSDDHSELPLVLLSHRGPVSFGREGDRRTATKGSGGLVTALLGLAEHLSDAVWVCAASSDEDIAVAREAEGRSVRVQTRPRLALVDDAAKEDPDGKTLEVRMVETDPWAHDAFYTVVSNPILWFIQHGLYGLTFAPVLTANEHTAFTDGYAAVNSNFADAVVEEVEARGGRALVMLQDYHFYLVAGDVRKRCPDALLSHFVHIPWPGPDSWRVLPPYMRDRLLYGLLGSDVVAFHTERYARNFIHCVKELLGVPVDLDNLSAEVDGRTVYARHYPISVDPAALESVAASDEVAAHVATLSDTYLAEVPSADESTPPRRLIVRVDRTDPSKNVVRGFLAFGVMLDQHPELAGTVSFLALLQPSRTDVAEYSDYIATIGAVVAEINARHTRNGQQPIDLRMVEDFQLAVAAYSICDVLMVNALADGMNLVAKEVPIVNQRKGVLALSENTGAHEELGAFAVTLYPFDIQQMADALYEALTMDEDKRADLLAKAAKQVRENDVAAWLSAQLRDLGTIRSDVPAPPE
ncbi:MAG TPA: trehalose-6-phosphate synthase [Frankiaceae bacterium]|nr:trehalose-6-phosphate synthase [Frankiaceae bacterium]